MCAYHSCLIFLPKLGQEDKFGRSYGEEFGEEGQQEVDVESGRRTKGLAQSRIRSRGAAGANTQKEGIESGKSSSKSGKQGLKGMMASVDARNADTRAHRDMEVDKGATSARSNGASKSSILSRALQVIPRPFIFHIR